MKLDGGIQVEGGVGQGREREEQDSVHGGGGDHWKERKRSFT